MSWKIIRSIRSKLLIKPNKSVYNRINILCKYVYILIYMYIYTHTYIYYIGISYKRSITL